MLIVPDVEDVYTPLQTDVIVQLSEVSYFMHYLEIVMELFSWQFLPTRDYPSYSRSYYFHPVLCDFGTDSQRISHHCNVTVS